MDEIKLKRGCKEVTFRKSPNSFAVRLNQGKAANEMVLASLCGLPQEVMHIESVAPERMDIFVTKDGARLEETMGNLRKAPASNIVTHMYSLDNTPGGAVIPTGTMTIQFKEDISEDERNKILAEFGLEIMEDLDFISNGYTVKLSRMSKENPLKIAHQLQQRSSIKIAEPDISIKLSFNYAPAESLYPLQWHLKNRGGQGMTPGADVKAEEAWEYTRGKRNITVCVMDDGFDLEHPDLGVNGKIVGPRDFGQQDIDPNPVFESDNHGTACAGVAIAEENGLGVVGLAPRCSFMPVRTSGWISDQSITELFKYAIDNHADVISCSWSASVWDFPLSTKMHSIIHKCATEGRDNKKGCVILFAAGNEDRPLNGEKDEMISHQGFALHPDVISVGASNSLDQRSSYSNYGAELALCAPSSGSPGRRIVTTDRLGTKGYSSTGITDDFGGTSSSTPLAAGLAALMLSINPELTSAEVKRIMMETADKIESDNGMYTNGHSDFHGHGRINAHKALAAVAGDTQPRLPEELTMEHRVNRPIPDLGDTEDILTFPLDVAIKDIEVNINIKHTWRGDLKVILRSPQGNEILLHDRTGHNEDDIVRSFRSSNEPDLFRTIMGTAAKGDWGLKIYDMAKSDVGVLVKWGLSITY